MATVGERALGSDETPPPDRQGPAGPLPRSGQGSGASSTGGDAPRPPRGRLSLLLHPRNVPGRLRLAVTGCLLVTVVLGAVCLTAADRAQSTWTGITTRQAPQVVDATGLYQSLTDLDAQTANLLMFGDAPSLASDRATALTQYDQDRAAADRDLQRATLDAAGDQAVQQALSSVLDDMGQYQDLAGRALELNQVSAAGAGQPDATALTEYRQATDLMRTGLLPAADKLVQANNNAFNDSYTAERSSLSTAELGVLLLGALVLAALLGLQIWLARTFRRIVNPPLAAATLLVVVLIGLCGTLLPDQRQDLYVARREAFDSVVALTRARAVAYDANADESRYLLDHGRAAQYQDAFEADSQQIAHLQGATIHTYDAALAADIGAYRADDSDVRFGGYYGTEFDNITFPGERAAAQQALLDYQAYELDDRRIRALADSGQLQAAIAYCTSYAPDASNGAFEAHDAALQKVIGINSDAYAAAAKQGSGELSTRIPLLAGCAGAALLLCLLGVRRRLGEFRP
jgi:hypothetical protein